MVTNKNQVSCTKTQTTTPDSTKQFKMVTTPMRRNPILHVGYDTST